MYDENSFQNYIFWLKVKRVFLMALFSIFGAIIGIIINTFVIGPFNLGEALKPLVIAGCTLLFFGISLVLTANVGRDVQEGYWKMAVLRKLTVISKKLDALDNLGNLENLENLENLRSLKTLEKASQVTDILPNMAPPVQEPPIKRTRRTKTVAASEEPAPKTTRTRRTTTKKATPTADEFEGFTVASDDPEQLFFQ